MSKLITVSGNGNSGKTVFTYFLANKLAIDGKRVMIVATNSTHPDFPYLLPIEKNKSANKSLGRVLSLAVIDQQAVLDNMLSFKNENIGLICYAVDESKNSYPNISSNNMEVFFELLQSQVDYIIVDTQACSNEIDKYVLSISDVRFCITTANLKGLAFRKHIKDDNSYMHILFSDSSFNPYEDIKATFALRVRYEMPYCKVLQSIYNQSFLDTVCCPKPYSNLLNKIIKEIIINE